MLNGLNRDLLEFKTHYPEIFSSLQTQFSELDAVDQLVKLTNIYSLIKENPEKVNELAKAFNITFSK